MEGGMMHWIRRAVAASLLLTGIDSNAAWAQQARESTASLVVPGFVYQQAVFGDDDPKWNAGAGMSIGVQIRGPRSGSTALVFEGTFHPNAVENPHYPEQFLPLYVQIGAQIGRGVFVRPSGGFAFQSGSLVPVLGAAIGRDHDFGGKYLAGAEFIIRASGSHGLFGWIAGVQVPIGVRPPSARPPGHPLR
jgi:hypothetical protein